MQRHHTCITHRIRRHLPPPRPRTKPPGSTYKRCSCLEPLTGRRLDTTCPLLRWSDHGTFYFYLCLPPADGRRRRMRRGGFDSEREAREGMQAELDQAGLALSATGCRPGAVNTFREYLAMAIAPGRTPGTRPWVRRRVRRWVRPSGLIRLSMTLRQKDRS
jgi:hypothetical protein